MIKMTCTEAEIAALRHWRFHHPDPRVQMRLEALYWRSHGVPNRDILRLCGISTASFHRYLTAYVTGGIEQLKHREPRPLRRALHHHRQPIEADFPPRPPATVAEAAARIEALTGIARTPPQVRQFLKALGMQPRKVGMIPAKADVAAQEAFKKTLLVVTLLQDTLTSRTLQLLRIDIHVCACTSVPWGSHEVESFFAS